MLCCRIVNGIKNKKHKKQPWGKVECFAFGGGIVRFAPRIKTARRFTAKKPLIIKNFLEGGWIKSLKFCMVGTRYFASASNDWYSIGYYSYSGRKISRPYQNVGYRLEKFDAVFYRGIIVSSGVFRRETASGFYPFGDATDLAGEGGVGAVV